MKQVRSKMTDLDRGLAIQARRAGFTLDALCEIFHRDYTTLKRLFRKHNIKRGRGMHIVHEANSMWNE